MLLNLLREGLGLYWLTKNDVIESSLLEVGDDYLLMEVVPYSGLPNHSFSFRIELCDLPLNPLLPYIGVFNGFLFCGAHMHVSVQFRGVTKTLELTLTQENPNEGYETPFDHVCYVSPRYTPNSFVPEPEQHDWLEYFLRTVDRSRSYVNRGSNGINFIDRLTIPNNSIFYVRVTKGTGIPFDISYRSATYLPANIECLACTQERVENIRAFEEEYNCDAKSPGLYFRICLSIASADVWDRFNRKVELSKDKIVFRENLRKFLTFLSLIVPPLCSEWIRISGPVTVLPGDFANEVLLNVIALALSEAIDFIFDTVSQIVFTVVLSRLGLKSILRITDGLDFLDLGFDLLNCECPSGTTWSQVNNRCISPDDPPGPDDPTEDPRLTPIDDWYNWGCNNGTYWGGDYFTPDEGTTKYLLGSYSCYPGGIDEYGDPYAGGCDVFGTTVYFSKDECLTGRDWVVLRQYIGVNSQGRTRGVVTVPGTRYSFPTWLTCSLSGVAWPDGGKVVSYKSGPGCPTVERTVREWKPTPPDAPPPPPPEPGTCVLWEISMDITFGVEIPGTIGKIARFFQFTTRQCGSNVNESDFFTELALFLDPIGGVPLGPIAYQVVGTCEC